MRASGVKRFICCLAALQKREGGESFMLRMFSGYVIKTILDDMARMESYLFESCQDLDFTILRPTGKYENLRKSFLKKLKHWRTHCEFRYFKNLQALYQKKTVVLNSVLALSIQHSENVELILEKYRRNESDYAE